MTPPPITHALCERISKKLINVSPYVVHHGLTTYPIEPVDQHWLWSGAGASVGTPFIQHKRLQPAARFLLSVVAQEEVPPTYKVCLACPFVNCVHPSCQELRPFRKARFGFLHPLPRLLQRGAGGKEQDIADLMDEFDNLENPTLPVVLATYGGVFDEGSIRQAFARYQQARRAGPTP